MDKLNQNSWIERNNKTKLTLFSSEINVKSINGPKGILMKESSLVVDVMIENKSNRHQTIWGKLCLQDPMKECFELDESKIGIPSNETVQLKLKGLIPGNVMSGDCTVGVTLWDKEVGLEIKKLAFARLKNVRIYHHKEYFKTWPKTSWLASDSKLGRSEIQSKNVSVKDGLLHLKLPRMTLNGAEIRTAQTVHYGSYEIRMKVPARTSSLTGFFLYKKPDFEQEIDIELMNQPEGIILFTTYAKGRQTQTKRHILLFDPTLDFHRYRIDYLPGRVSFFIDDQLIQTWTEGLPSTPMFLMLNSWYPNWLGGLSGNEDSFLIIDWILQ